MRDYEYVPRSEWKPVRKEILAIIREVQNLLKDRFTFSFAFIGSSHRGMITREVKGNRGYDFDVDIRVNDDEEDYSAGQLKHILHEALRQVSMNHGYSTCEDSSSVITMKMVDVSDSRIEHSCDFAIVNNYSDRNGKKHQQFVFFDKKTGEYVWRERSKEYCDQRRKEIEIKQAGMWNEVRDVYREKKKRFSDWKKSRALYAETINEVYIRLKNSAPDSE